jgi:hypothetical protein
MISILLNGEVGTQIHTQREDDGKRHREKTAIYMAKRKA